MPRPKRTKVAPSIPASRQKAAKSTPAVEARPQPAKKPFDDLYDVSDQEERPTIARHVQKDTGKGKGLSRAVESGASGLMSGRDGGGKMGRTRSPSTEKGRAVSAELQNEDYEIEGLSSSPEVEVGRRDKNTPAAAESSIFAIGNFKRRPREPSILGARAARARSSSVESNLAEGTGLMSVGRKNTSALGMGTFKNRQLSRTGLDSTRATPARVGSALKIGAFKRRAREPSILLTGQKEQQRRPNFESEEEQEDEDDFNPDDESTPLNLSKSKTLTSSSSTSNPRKRKLSDVQIPQSQASQSSPTVLPPADIEAEDSIPATGPLQSEDEQEPDDAVSTSEVPMPSMEGARPVTPEPMSETMAPPYSSSSSLPSPENSPPRQVNRFSRAPATTRGRRTLREKTPPPATQDSPISSPPSLTHSPNRPEHGTLKGRPRAQPQPTTFSTAQLQALLPRRRRRQPDIFDMANSDEVDTSGLGADDDELTIEVRAPTVRRNNFNRPPAPLSPKRRGPKPKAKSAPSKSTGKEIGPKRTYGRATTSDKENEDEMDPDDSLAPLRDDVASVEESSQELEKRVGKELKRAARKFQEVDKWELDFEEVTASSSSPRDGR